MLFDRGLTRDETLLLHFILSSILFILLAHSKRLNARLVAPAKNGFVPRKPQLPGYNKYRKALQKRQKEMELTYKQKSADKDADTYRKKYRVWIVKVKYWLETRADYMRTIFKDIGWFLREKLRLFPSAATGVYVNTLAAVVLAGSYRFLYNLYMDNQSLTGYTYYDDPEMISSAAEQLSMLFSFIFPLLLCGAFFLFFIFLGNREVYFDFFGIEYLLFIALYKSLQCAYYDCCFGIPSTWGVFNSYLEGTAFPIQYFESASALLGVVICVAFMLFAKAYRPGRVLILSLAWFSLCRFVAEFFRYHGPEYRPNAARNMWGLSVIHWVCIIAFIAAIAALFLLPLEKKLLDAFTTKCKAIATRIHVRVFPKRVR